MSLTALEGLRPWILQRLTAVYMLVYCSYAFLYWTFFTEFKFQSWKDWISSDFNQVALVLFYMAMMMHAWIGMRDIILDYVKPMLVRMMALFVVAVFLLACAAWLVKILMMVNG